MHPPLDSMKADLARQAERPSAVRWEILALLMAFSFMSWFNRLSISVAGTMRIKEQFSLSETQLGNIYTAFFVAYALFMTPAGWLADRFGARTALAWVGFGSALFGGLTGVVGFDPSQASLQVLGMSFGVAWLLFIGVRFLMGFFTAPIYPASGRMVGHWIPAHQRARANGLITGAALVGNASSFMIFGAMIKWFDWPVAFLISGTVTALLAVLWMFCTTAEPRQHRRVNPAERRLIEGAEPAASLDPVAGEPKVPWTALLANRSLVLLTLSYAAVGYFEYLFFFWTQYYFDKVLNVGEDRSRYYSTVVMLAMAGGMAGGGWLSDWLLQRLGPRRGRAAVPIGGMLAGAVLLVCGLVTKEPVWIVVWFALALAAVGAVEGPSWTTAVDLGGRRGGLAFGIFNTGGNVGGLLAPTITPWVQSLLPARWDEVFRWQVAISLGAAVCLVGALLWCWIDPREGVAKSDAGERLAPGPAK